MLNKNWFTKMEARERREVVVWIILSLLIILVLAYFAFLAPKGPATIEVTVKPFQQDSIIWINLVRGRFLPLQFVSKEHRPSGIVAGWDPSFTFVGLKSGWYRYYVMELESEVPSYLCASAIVDYMVCGEVNEVIDPGHCIIVATQGEIFVEEGSNSIRIEMPLPEGAPDGRG